jgi:hypothetical protein
MELGRLREFNRVFGLRVLAFGVIALIGQLYSHSHICASAIMPIFYSYL